MKIVLMGHFWIYHLILLSHILCDSCNGPESHQCSQCSFASREEVKVILFVLVVVKMENMSVPNIVYYVIKSVMDVLVGVNKNVLLVRTWRTFWMMVTDLSVYSFRKICPSNKYENTINSTCDQCHPYCAECVGPNSTNCTSCNDPPGYIIIPPEGNGLGLFGCCDPNSIWQWK